MKKIPEWMQYVIIILVVVLFRTFVATPVRVVGASMDKTLKQGEILILKKYDKDYERFDIVVIKEGNERIIKRIIGLPGESIKIIDNVIYINGEELKDDYASSESVDFSLSKFNLEVIPTDCYFVLGDNREVSKDSRTIGVINKKDILGTTGMRIWPLNNIGDPSWVIKEALF